MSVDTRPPSTGTPAAPPSGAGAKAAALGRALVFPVLAALLAFAVGALVILASGNNPVEAYAALLRGGFGSRAGFGRTLLGATPLIFTGLAVAIPFRAGLFNIGGEGQLFVGAITAAWLAISFPVGGAVAIVVAITGGGLAGFLWGAIPGLLKIRGAHEVITTIMLNFVAANLTYYLAQGVLSGGGTVPGTALITESRRLLQLGGGLGRAHWGIALGVLAAVAAYLLLWRTTKGFAIRAVGLAPEAARCAGIPVASNAVLAIALGGLFAGLGGAIEVLGPYGRVSVPFVSNLGFNGIGVALLGRNHPAGVVLGALFFGGLASGAQEMQFSAGVPLDLADVLLAVVLLLVTATKLVQALLGRRLRGLAQAEKLERGLA